MTETEILLIIIGFVVFPGAVIGFIVFSFKRTAISTQRLIADLTPLVLTDGVVVSGGAVELRARAGQGAHKIWLECTGGSGRWTAIATVAHRVSASQAGYRDAAPEASMTKEPPITFGEDGDGITVI